MRRFLLGCSVALALALIGGSGSDAYADPSPVPAQGKAPQSVSAELIVLHGTNDNSGIDPQIGKIPALSKPPFSAYNSYKLLSRTGLSLGRGKATQHKLPTGRELNVVYKDVIEPQKQGEARRFVVTASIDSAGGKAFLPHVEVNAKPGEWFFVGGQEYKGGSLVIGIKLTP
jgi:hypothetical protein